MKDKIIVGLDIGTTKICAIVGKKNEYGTLEVLGMDTTISDGMIRGVVLNIDKTVRAIKKVINKAGEQSDTDIRAVNVGIAGRHIKSAVYHDSITRKDRDEEITIEDLSRLASNMHRIVTPPGSEIIHVMPQDYMVDHEDGIMDPVGMTGVKLEADFHIITAQTDKINQINKCVRKSKLEIENLILEPLASSLSVLSEKEKESGVCLVDIGGGTTDVAVFYDNIIRHTSVIPFGGNIITSDIKQGCMVREEHAELLKTKFGKAIAEKASPNEIVSIPGLKDRPPKEISIKNLAHVIEARMQEIIELVHTEIITSGYHKKLLAGIVVTGGGSQLNSLSQLFEYMTGLDTRIGHPNEHLGKSNVDAVKNPMYATSVGLVLSGFRALDIREMQYGSKEKMKQGNNFFSDILKKTKDLLFDDFDDKRG